MRMLSSKSDKRPLFAWLFVAGWVVAFLLVFGFLRQPLHIDYGISWAIFALFATLNLEYVSLRNRLGEKLHKPSPSLRDDSKEKGEGIVFLLAWTSVFFTLTILVLGLRICLHSFCPECQGSENPIPQQYPLDHLFLWCDRVIVSTFLTSLVLRVVVFFYSYGRNLLASLGWRTKRLEDHAAKLDGPQSAASS